MKLSSVCSEGKVEFKCGEDTVMSIPKKTRAFRGDGKKIALCRFGRELASFTAFEYEQAVNLADWKAKVKGRGYGRKLLECFIDSRPNLYMINTDGFSEAGRKNFERVAESKGYQIIDHRVGGMGGGLGGYAKAMHQDAIDAHVEAQEEAEKAGKRRFFQIDPAFHSRNKRK